MRLSPETLDRLPADVARFSYSRAEQQIGIVHFGIGAFHRAHQAWYTDMAMNGGERDWLIDAVSLRSAAVADQLNPQGGLYTLTERGAAGATRVIGAVRQVRHAPSAAPAIASVLAAPKTSIVTLTITEKGYCRAADGSLDLSLASEGSVYRHLVEAFRRRRAAGVAGLTLLSCDNLADNGRQFERLMREYMAANAPDLLGWFESECACPNSMVDRIVPATTEADLDALEAGFGLRDEGAVFPEPFSQWVIEDRFVGRRPGWEKVGAQLVTDVTPYETAKLRMLNGAHSALAYLGLERGHEYVHQAVSDPELCELVERLMRREAATSFAPAPGQDLEGYTDALLARFANPALNHQLAQIAMDGSQKVPQRWLASLAAHQAIGETCEATLTALAAWLRHVRGDPLVNDPLAGELADAWRRHGAGGIVAALFGAGGLIPSAWHPGEGEQAFLERKLAHGEGEL